MNIPSTSLPRRQHGVALLVALILLVVMTLLGLSAMDSVMMETKVAANAQERTYAFQIAETALAESEQLFGDTRAAAQVIGQDDREMLVNPYLAPGLNDIKAVNRDEVKNLKGGLHRADLDNDGKDDDAAVMEYRGIFPPVAGVSSSFAFSAVETSMSYFELMTVSENLQGNSDAQQFKVRAGYRQLVPKTGP